MECNVQIALVKLPSLLLHHKAILILTRRQADRTVPPLVGDLPPCARSAVPHLLKQRQLLIHLVCVVAQNERMQTRSRNVCEFRFQPSLLWEEGKFPSVGAQTLESSG